MNQLGLVFLMKEEKQIVGEVFGWGERDGDGDGDGEGKGIFYLI